LLTIGDSVKPWPQKRKVSRKRGTCRTGPGTGFLSGVTSQMPVHEEAIPAVSERREALSNLGADVEHMVHQDLAKPGVERGQLFARHAFADQHLAATVAAAARRAARAKVFVDRHLRAVGLDLARSAAARRCP